MHRTTTATNYTHNTSAGTNAYTWDRANRLLSMGGISYEYDGMGNRVSQTANSIVTQYLLDVQPGLVKVLAETTSGATTRYIHGPRGLERQQQASGAWVFSVQDGLGSVRGEVSVDWPDLDVNGTKMYAPYGVPFGAEGAMSTAFGFTGEMTDANELVFLRARYLSPGLGVFVSRDPVENLNRYGYVSANPVNCVDPSGLWSEEPDPTPVPVPAKTPPPNPTNGTPTPEEILRAYTCAGVKLWERKCPFKTNTCEAFIEQVHCIISQSRDSLGLAGFTNERQILMDLADYYSGNVEPISRLNQVYELNLPFVKESIMREERYPAVGGYVDHESPLFKPEGQDLRISYGFRRPYVHNTHHYFAYLFYAYDNGSATQAANFLLESGWVADKKLDLALSLEGVEKGSAREDFLVRRYAWRYYESVIDLYLVRQAVLDSEVIRNVGIDALPHLLKKWCSKSEGDFWALEDAVAYYYFEFRPEFWPPPEFWPDIPIPVSPHAVKDYDRMHP